MKFRVAGACASIILLAGCSGGNPGSQIGSLRNTAAASQSAAKGSPQLSLGRKANHSIANAPNRGALVNYQNGGKPAKVEGAYTWYPIAISEEHAMQALLTGQMTVPSPDGSQVKLRYERHEEHPDGNWTWVGRVDGGDPNQEAILTFGEKAVFGSIPQSDGPPLSLETRQGVLYAVKTDPSKVRNPNTAATDIMLPPALALRESVSQAAAVQQGATMQSAVMAGAPPTAANTIDVAVGYTAGFAASVGGQSAAVTRLTHLAQVGNQAFENSQVNGYLRLVRAIQVNYTDSTKNSDALSELTGNNGTANVPIPASLVPLRDARNEFGADVAVLVRRFQTPENDGCGVAWLNGADQKAINPATDANYAFAVISDGSDQGSDNNTYICAPETMVHEIGHIAGSAHDRDNSKKANGELQYGSFAYSFGMKTDSANGNFYTIMSYGSNNQTPYRTFSNPNITFCGGRACGVANTTDNARSLNQTIPVVAQFRATVVPFAGGAPNDFDGDGKSEVYWRNTTTGVNDLWVMSGATLTAAYPIHREPNQSWVVVGTGDFNGDGKADVLWRHNGSGQVYIHFMSGTSILPTSGNSVAVADLNWQVVAIADFDGDGVSDIYWRHSASGSNSLWLMNGLAPKSTTAVYWEPNLAWKIVGAGDFNGDGFADLFWRNSSTGENFVQFMKGNAVQNTSAFSDRVAEQAFQVVAIRDFNNDGKADLYWRNTTTGQNWMWTMDGAKPSRITYVHYEPNQAWQIVNSGDYNGDGNMDLFWRNTSTGQTYVHLMQNTVVLAGSGMSTAVPNMSWQVVGR
jgi:peptidyl-Asp metalloendopeptidase